jgi:spore germination protein YaaH
MRKIKPWTKKQRRLGCLSISLALIAFLTFLTLDYYFYPWGMPLPAHTDVPRQENAIWVHHTYYFGEKTDTQIQALAQNLERRDIRETYFHVRFIKKDGTLRFRYPDKAKHLLETFRKDAPRTRAIAWIYAGNPRGEGAVDLHNPAVRAQMVAQARWLCETCGFDGVQWDYEICEDGDPDLLALLAETRAALSAGKTLGVCAPMCFPVYGWSEAYIAQVAAHVDHLAVMCYDTGFLLPRAYVDMTAQQVVHFTRAVALGNPKARFWMGVPTYGKGFFSHNPRAENITNSLRGIREGRRLTRNMPQNLAGVALFAEYTTDASEWEIYEHLWQ